jgi:uncharacterized protein with NAD-binding domain and iron-sulfur cluster
MKSPKDKADSSPGISRRRFLRGAALGGAAVAGESLLPGLVRRSWGGSRPTVAVFGGGIAGLTAAHELIQRGFDVTVYERRAWGGKARSTEVPGSGSGGRKPLPGEHGFRFEFGSYWNLPDTLRRIPFGSNPNGVFDNMVACPEWGLVRDQGRRPILLPSDTPHYSPKSFVETVTGLLLDTHLPPPAIAHFTDRMVVFLSSCDERRWNQWENTTWTDFIAADQYGDDYQKTLGEIPRLGQASKPEETSATWVAQALEMAVYNLMGRGSNGALWRTMNAPTNEAWIEPWLAELRRLGVDLRLGHTLESLEVNDGRIAGSRMSTPNGERTAVADWYVCAIPLERARQFWNPAILAVDPNLERMWRLETSWMNGMKFFLREDPGIAQGPVGYTDGSWAISSVHQAQFWASDFASTYGDGRVKDSFSVIVSDWTTPGLFNGKPARECTPEEIVAEVWQQIKQHVNKPGEPPRLTDDMLVSWDIDPGMIREGGRLISDDPLPMPTVGSRPDRPEPGTAVPNLMLAGDYVKSELLVGTMEQANEAGRRACNAILERSGSRESPSKVFPRYRPPEWEPLKRLDEDLYRAGRPNLFDVSPFGSQSLRSIAARLG